MTDGWPVQRWIRGGQVLRRRSGRWDLELADVAISAGAIAEVVPASPGDRAALGPGDIDAARRIIIPGLINAHLHSNDDFLRGRVDKLPLEIYMLMAVPVTGVTQISPADLRTRTLLGAIEGLKTGTTCFLDDCYHIDSLRPEGIDAVMSAYEEIGARAWVTANLSDLPMPDTIPFVKDHLDPRLYAELLGTRAFSAEAALDICENAIGRYNKPDARVRVAMAASGPQRCSDNFLRSIWDVVGRYDVPCVSHVLETRVQAVTGPLFYGETLIAHMARLGCLTPRTVIAHGVWVTDEDIDTIARRGASVVHNPTSNLRLGSGVAPVPTMLDAGINVALGSDGMTSNDAQNLFLEMRLAGCLHNIKNRPYAQWIGAPEAFSMATTGGAAALGMADTLGQIEPGMRADLCLLDTDSAAYVPLNDPVQNIVFSEYGQSVRTVLVEGEVVVDAGRIVKLDEAEFYGEARDAAARFFRDNEDAFGRLSDFVPAFEAAYARARLLHGAPRTASRWIEGE
jgi:5-methylthioadenosine/S-adenosylhomocysteine deaminase